MLACEDEANFLKEETSYCKLKLPSIHEQNCGELSIKSKQNLKLLSILRDHTPNHLPKPHISNHGGESCAD